MAKQCQIYHCAQVCLSTGPRWPWGLIFLPRNFLRWKFAHLVQFKFKGVLFRSDSRHNDRVDSLLECATKQAVMTVAQWHRNQTIRGLWLSAKKELKMDSCSRGAILNLTAFCSIWTVIEECSSINQLLIEILFTSRGAILNLTAFCPIWTVIEECSSINQLLIEILFTNFILRVLAYVEKLQSNEKNN